ncbi:MAG: YwiC-like family protein [Blastocatellia bacterium]|nr:YwiC-like family protein [Blastocatellia bacterium]
MSIRKRLELPKEHGAWVMLYVPFVVGALVAGSFSLRVLLLLSSVTFVFIARESLIVWWRARSRGQSRPSSLRLMLIYLGLAALSGVPLVFIYRLYITVPLGFVALVLLGVNAEQAVRREDRTIFGEVMAILGLTLTAPAAYYVARASWEITALWLWALNALYFASSVFYVKLRVHAINPRKEQESRNVRRHCAFYHVFLLASLLVLVLTDSLSLLAVIAFAPVLVRTFWHLFKPGERLNLRRIGVLEIVYSVVFLVFITLTFRPA